MFNSKHNNEDLMNDRVKRGTKAMISIQGFMREASLGIHTVNVYLLLHNAIFLASILFNAQAWSNISNKNVQQITTIQLKFLKKMMKARPSTANSFVFLELGTLPMKYELHKRQLSFLHHIIQLDEDDPVRLIWKHQVEMPAYNNWWTGVNELMVRYSLELTEVEIKELSKEAYKEKIKKAVRKKAFEDLKLECHSKENTKNLNYTEFKKQKYIVKLYPNHSSIIFRCRSKTLNIKDWMQYKYGDDEKYCRWCGVSDETLDHIVNCGYVGETIDSAEHIVHGSDLQKMKNIAERVEDFLQRVEV